MKKQQNNKLLRFTSLGIQMLVIIGGFSALGNYLDGKYHSERPWWTLGLALFGIFTSLYLIIKEAINMGKDED
jgi:ATP synthase protein I